MGTMGYYLRLWDPLTNTFLSLDISGADYQIEIPANLVVDPTTDIQVTPKFFTKQTDPENLPKFQCHQGSFLTGYWRGWTELVYYDSLTSLFGWWYIPDENDFVVGLHGENYEGLTQISTSFIDSDAGKMLLETFRATFLRFGFREHKTTTCLFCTLDNWDIRSLQWNSNLYSTFITISHEDSSIMNCKGLLNYRPFIIVGDDQTKVRWLAAIYGQSHTSYWLQHQHTVQSRACGSDGSSDESLTAHGIFIRTELFNKVTKSCGIDIE